MYSIKGMASIVLTISIALLAFGNQAFATHSVGHQDKVNICHRTNSVTNPYVKQEVAISAVDGIGNGDHFLEHTGPIATSQAFAQALKDAKIEWGDIIPPITNVHSGLNWTAIGQAMLRNDCAFVVIDDEGSVRVNKEVDEDGDGTFEGGNTEANILGFRWGIDNDLLDNQMGSTQSGVSAGGHLVKESDVAGFEFVGWYTTNSRVFSCTNPESTAHPVSITVVKDTTTEITFCNSKQPEQPTDGEPQITQMAAPVGGVEAGGGGAAASTTAPLLGLGGSLSAVGYSLLRMRRN